MPTVTPIVVFNVTAGIKGIRLTEIPLTVYPKLYTVNILKVTVDCYIIARCRGRTNRNPGKPIPPTIRAVMLKTILTERKRWRTLFHSGRAGAVTRPNTRAVVSS